MVALRSASVRAQVVAELVGTAFLLMAVVGSGIAGERMSQGNDAIALLANSAATALALFVLILAVAPVSGAHFNPLVTAVAFARREVGAQAAGGLVLAQLAGAMIGVAVANAMFEIGPWVMSERARDASSLWLSEVVATIALLAVIRSLRAYPNPVIAAAVAATIGAGYWYTSSTSFANPVVTIARAFTPTFTGIRLVDVGPFVVAQVAAMVGIVFVMMALPTSEESHP